MNVLLVNKFYYLKGGSETYLFALEDELKKRGHNLIPFSMHDSRNNETKYSTYFVDNIDYNNLNLLDKFKMATKVIYSVEANKKMKLLVKENNIDIAHLHLFQHQLSPSILFPLKKKGIPVVYTVHDLKVMCPNYKMMTNGKVCEECKGGKYYNSLFNKCTKNSLLGSSINMIEAYLHDWLKIYDKYIDHFITPSAFYKDKMIEWGFAENKITHVPNFVNKDKFEPTYSHKNYYLYLGRLSEEKGILTLLKAMKLVNSDTKLLIAGTGPLQDIIKTFIMENNLEFQVELLGFVSGMQLENIIKSAKCMIIPSEWYENGPLSLIECFAYGKPVIGSNIGGIPEHIDDSKNGFLFQTHNYQELALKMTQLNNMNDVELEQLGKHGRLKVEGIYNSEYHMNQIDKIYKSVLKEVYV